MKKKVFAIAAISFFIIAAIIVLFAQKDSFSLKINDNEISKEEFLAAAAQKRYEVVSYFSEKGGGNVDA